MIYLFPLAAVFTLGALIWRGERPGDAQMKWKWIFKPLTSALFLLTGLARGPQSVYDGALLAGLVLCLAGDVLLIPKERKWFTAGLIAFLLGHIAYIFAFSRLIDLPRIHALHGVFMVGLAVFSMGVYIYFRPHLGQMARPVAVYVIVITFMLVAAWLVFATTVVTLSFRVLVALGAAAFYVSDIAVARDRFMGARFPNRAIGLVLYYLGQFALAFSIGML